MERPLLLDRKHITVSVKQPVIKWMNALVSLNQANEFVLTDHTHANRLFDGRI